MGSIWIIRLTEKLAGRVVEGDEYGLKWRLCE
jgi:hypothetical protein